MATKNLWGGPLTVEIKPPVAILAEQAGLVGEMTNNILEGKIDNQGQGKTFAYELDIVAPALNNYVYAVLRIEHSIQFYPLRIMSYAEPSFFDKPQECKDEIEFVNTLEQILSSNKVRAVLSALLIQSRAFPKQESPF